MNRTVLILVATVLLVVFLLVAGAGGFIWWKISSLKQDLVQQLEKKIGAQVQVSSLDLDPWAGELRAAGISLTNDNPTAPWQKGDISQATVHFRLLDIFSSTMPVSVEVGSWNVVLSPYASGPSEAPANPMPDASTQPGPASPAPGRLRVDKLVAQDGSVEIDLSGDRKILVHGVNFDAENNGAGVWSTDVQATSLEAGTLSADASSVHVRAEPNEIVFSGLRLACDQGFVTGEGQVALTPDRRAHLALKATQLPLEMLVAAAWQMKLAGLVSGDLTYDSQADSASAKGQISIDHAKFNVLPWLDKVTSLVGLPEVSNVDLDQATADFSWKDQSLHLTNVDVRKNDVMRVTGSIDLDPAGNVDGKLKLGLPSTVTGKWPALQDQVFSFQQDDYNWADVHLTGTPDHLQEDLTPRLLTATLQEGAKDGNLLIDQATKQATDLIKSVLGN